MELKIKKKKHMRMYEVPSTSQSDDLVRMFLKNFVSRNRVFDR